MRKSKVASNVATQAALQTTTLPATPPATPVLDAGSLAMFQQFLAFQAAQAAANGNGQHALDTTILPASPPASPPAPAKSPRKSRLASATKSTESAGTLLNAPVMVAPLNTAPRTGIIHGVSIGDTPQFDNSHVVVPGRLDPQTNTVGKPQKCYLKPETRGFIRTELQENLPTLTLAVLDEDNQQTKHRLTLKFTQSSSGSLMYSVQGPDLHIPVGDEVSDASVKFHCQGVYFIATEYARRLQPGDNAWTGR